MRGGTCQTKTISRSSESKVDESDASFPGKTNPINLNSTTTRLSLELLLSVNGLEKFPRFRNITADTSAFHGAYDTNSAILVVVVGAVDAG
jgi:hypothetical protein